jgi:hypothetical protein
MAIPVWGWLVAGVVAAGSALWYFSDKTKKLADGLLKATHPSLLSTPGGGYKFAPLGPEIERQLAGETPAWNDMRLPQYQKNIGGSAPQIYDRKEIMKWRDQINKQLEMGATPEEFSESLSGALAVHAILQEDFDNLTRYMEGQTRQSDFSGIIGGPGTEEYGEKKTAGPSHFFSAQTYGSAEEYRMRVTGQQSLVQATTGLLNEAKATKQATQETAKNTAAIKDSLAPSEPLNLKK